jgi:hypothetical protein
MCVIPRYRGRLKHNSGHCAVEKKADFDRKDVMKRTRALAPFIPFLSLPGALKTLGEVWEA